MDEANKSRRLFWLRAIFVLNAAAIVLWFYLSGFFAARELAFTGLTPRGAEVDAESVSEIDIEFDAALDPASIKENAVRLVPPVQGKAELVDGKVLRYRLLEKLHPATTYQVLWSPKIRGKHGQSAPQELAEFSTTRFAFVDASQVAFDRDSYTVELAFNQPLSASDLELATHGRFSLPGKNGDDADRWKVLSSGISRTHRIRIRESRASYVGIAVQAGLTGRDGNLGLADDVNLVWRVAGSDAGGGETAPDWAADAAIGELKPTLSFLGMSGEWEDTAGVVRVRTSAPLDTAKAGDFVRIEPAVPVTFSQTWNGMKISGDFQPGKQYRITLKRGLPAGDAGELDEDVGRNVWFDDLPATVAFSFGGGYLTPGGLLKVPVETVNVAALHVAARRLYPSNLVEMAVYDYGGDVEEEYAEPVRETEIAVGRHPNQRKQTLLDIRALAGGEPKGVYGLEIRPTDERWRTRQATVVVSDIGLSVRVGKSRLQAWTVSLEKGVPLPECRVRVYSNRRQLIAEGATDKDGVVDLTLPNLAGDEKAVLAIAGDDEEMTFVRLDKNRNFRDGHAASGAAYPAGYEAFVALDRGVYRGGETVKATLLVRDDDAGLPPKLPVVMRLVGGDKKSVLQQGGTIDAQGRFSADLPLPRQSRGGMYRVEACLPGGTEPIGSASFRVADYIPETLRLTLSLAERVDPSAPASLGFQVDRLAGGEAGTLPGTVDIGFAAEPFAPEAWRGWNFGDARIGNRETKKIERRFTTAPDGSGVVEWSIPDLTTPAAVRMSVRAEVVDHGGRATMANLARTVHPARFYLGLKGPEKIVSGDSPAFSLVAVDGDGGVFSPETEWRTTLYRVEYNSVFKRRDDGRLVYEWTRSETEIDADAGGWKDGRAETAFGSLPGGRYRLVAETGGGKSATLDFDVGGDGNVWVADDPERMPASMEKASHAIGSTATVLFTAPFPGLALVTVETDRVLERRLVDFVAGENRVELPVTERMRPNAFVAATLIRPTRAEAAWKPHRAHGVARLDVDNTDRKLSASITTPDVLVPGKPAEITVDVAAPDGTAVENASVVLWAVDEGVLSLTNFTTPSPWEYFYRRRRLTVADVDMYSRLAPELEEWRSGVAPLPGGDAGADEAALRMSPIAADRVKAVVLHRGDLTTDAAGRATATFAVPEAAVGLRFMAWASAAGMMGAGESGVEIRAPISFISSWPRFAAPGDEFAVTVLVLNRSGKDGEAVVSGTSAGGLTFLAGEASVSVPDGKPIPVSLIAKADSVGAATARITARLGDDSFTEEIELPIRPPVMFQRLSGVVRVEGKGSVSLEPGKELAADGRVKLMAGGSPQLNLAGCLEYLLSYPYGCSEQTAARLAAIVALPDLLALSRPDLVGPEELGQLARAALDRLAAMQNGNGGFRLWPTTGSSSFWATAQILYILEECVAHGVEVPESMLSSSRRYLRDAIEPHMEYLTRMPDGDAARYTNGEDVGIACLALAKSGSLRRSWLVRLAEIAESRRADEVPLSPAALAFLCEATWIAGDPERAGKLFDLYGPDGEAPGASGDAALDGSAWLSAGLRLGIGEERLAPIANGLSTALADQGGGWSTRQNAFVSLSLGKYWRMFRPDPGVVAEVSVDGAAAAFPAARGNIWENLRPGVEVTATASEGGGYFLFWSAEGVPLSGSATEKDMGLVVRRSVATTAGQALPTPFVLRQGESYDVTITVTGDADDLVVADLLPAGLEIEIPHLGGRGEFGQTDDDDPLGVRHAEHKDDRLLLFGTVAGRGVYRYRCRAVTPGDYVWPAIDAARMYDAAVWSAHGQSRLRVEPITPAGEATK